jgi:hypothetical protein
MVSVKFQPVLLKITYKAVSRFPGIEGVIITLPFNEPLVSTSSYSMAQNLFHHKSIIVWDVHMGLEIM